MPSGLHFQINCKPNDISFDLHLKTEWHLIQFTLKKQIKSDEVSFDLHFKIKYKPDDNSSDLYNFSKRKADKMSFDLIFK